MDRRALALLLLLTACGGGAAVTTRAPDSTSPGATTTAPTPSSTTKAEPAIDPRDEELADAALLRSADLPGWSASSDPAPSDAGPFEQPPRGCEHLGTVTAIGTTSAHVVSPTFTAPDDVSTLSNELRVYTRSDDAATALATFDQPETAACLETLITSSGAGLFVSSARVQRQLLDVADGGVRHLVTVEVEQDGELHMFVAEFSLARIGRAISFQSAFGYGTVPNEAAFAMDAVIRRVQPAFG